jgi:hypothetical protein
MATDINSTTRRAALASILAFPTALTAEGSQPVPTMCIELDPIHAAIERCQAAYDAVQAVCARTDAMADRDPRIIWADVWEIEAPFWTELTAARTALFATHPTTLDGCVAALRFVSRPEFTDLGHDMPPASFLLMVADGIAGSS